jgi:hypothetical protein
MSEKKIKNVYLEPIKHRYFDDDGGEYRSVSKVLSMFVEEFNSDLMAGKVADKRLREYNDEALKRGVSLNVIRAEKDLYERGVSRDEVLREWDLKRDSANTRGTSIHEVLENMVINQKMPLVGSLGYDACVSMRKFLVKENYYMVYPEVVMYSDVLFFSRQLKEKYVGVAGTADLRCQRQNSKGVNIIDYYDYKSNIIKFDSSKDDKGKKKHYNRFMKYPLDHLEDCNYNKYCLQMSLYAYMDQKMYNTRIGRMAIINVEDGFKLIPVPYMKMEVELIIKYLEEYDVILCR